GYADQLAREEQLSPPQSLGLGKIVHAAKHMRDVVNIVLDYARVEALGPVIHMHPVDVPTLVRDCLAVIEPGTRARGLDLRSITAADAPSQFITDDIQLRQILVNLLSNA